MLLYIVVMSSIKSIVNVEESLYNNIKASF